ncbi:RagB/SusD family nutrient uptake outer membrane protein [Flavivirga spongiicola]|uniref:RagB/SusD family nutrient uptake outer membrane protein n=1 Tax=Flavivirga spongiicola TaxID=421621 RepID=A0ABU7XRI3_9FLAO|nr:RagB/SusD family nutrient uptake outer membrane protein [Flavivirga sp. MEBiC05379]MDO5978368.1 RagB/SusD family nutrient uptake outer membrane protein [Flavivirga sp. MEBiC05379]
MMNNNINYIVGMLFFFCIMSCDIKEIPPHQLVKENAVTNSAQAEQALNGAFVPLESINEAPFAADYVTSGSLMAGLAVGGFGSFDDQLIENEFTSSNGWNQSSDMINSANFAIEGTSALSPSEFNSPERRNEIIAEATFMRFFGQYYLFRYFGQHWDLNSPYGGLMRRATADLSNANQGRETVADTYTMLLEDLDFVIANASDFSTPYRPSKLLAKAYKAEVLLMRGTDADLQEAITIAQQVLNDSGRSMAGTYAEVFNTGFDSSELLFTRAVDDRLASIATRNVDSMLNIFGGLISISPAFETLLGADLRAPLYIEEINDALTVPKMSFGGEKGVMFYMRTSQMLLIQAEAHARLGNKNDAIDAINELRVRAGETLLDASSISDNDLSLTIYNEIAKEIGFEKGEEWFAAIRLKDTSGEPLVFGLKSEVTSVNQLIWPIPSAEIEFNEPMDQNPGYEQL